MPFQDLTLPELRLLLATYPARRITAVHWHHSLRPRVAGYHGAETLAQLERFHRESLSLSDTAQHLTVAPDGTLWLGRDWDAPPASAAGHNGNEHAGPFMIMLLGDFGTGRDRLEGKQLEAALAATALIQRRFSLPPESLRFHSQLSATTCPGLDYEVILEQVRRAQTEVAAGTAGAAEPPLGRSDLAVFGYVRDMQARPRRRDPEGAELPEGEMSAEQLRAFDESGAAGGARAQDRRLSTDMLSELRPYVVNLSEGGFSESGRYQTSPDDVDAIMGEHLPKALEAVGEKLPVVFYAHGGLVSEEAGLWRAYQDVRWWRENGVYPIYFVWETGLLETLARLLRDALLGARAARFAPTDWLIEQVVRRAYGVRVWSAMKRSAERSVAPETGGARYVARAFANLFEKPGGLTAHAVGHSAGAVFHSHFLPELVGQKVEVTTAHLLAPAVRTDTFKALYAPLMGKGVAHTAIFTMNKVYEFDDTCLNLYQKSLLYLIHHALEPAPRTPILGLEESLRADPDLRKAFGLAGNAAKVGEVVFSKTAATGGRRASTAAHHGDFNDDGPTMNSVLRRVLDLGDRDDIVPFPAEAVRSSARPTLERLDDLWAELLPEAAWQTAAPGSVFAPVTVPVIVTPPPPGAGRRRALCVGVNSYADAPLQGCVADARLWAERLASLGFAAQLLLDREASRAAILQALESLLVSSAPGEWLVFQFAGHGTYVPDDSGDEDDGYDEAICPIDAEAGYLLTDDDIADVFARTPPGVQVTCFLDCCHSGTGTRFAVGAPPRTRNSQQRARFLPPNRERTEAHRRFRAALGGSRATSLSHGPDTHGPDTMREVVFSACQPQEVAYENGGQGDFTLRATGLLMGAAGLSNRAFNEKVIQAFGVAPQQHPHLDCAPGNLEAGFLGLGGTGRGAAPDEAVVAALRLLTRTLGTR